MVFVKRDRGLSLDLDNDLKEAFRSKRKIKKSWTLNGVSRSELELKVRDSQEKNERSPFKPGGSMYMPYKEGSLKMEGQKVYVATKGEEFAYYKSANEFNFGQPISRLKMNLATVKDIVDKKKFQVIFPFRTFTFGTDSEEEKRQWIEALQDAVAESLSDYKVLNEISSVEANLTCADCGCDKPDWASVNLAIVICKHCAGIHRELGVHNSKVRSLKMDVKVWTEDMKNMIKTIGNDTANGFWRAKVNGSDAISDMADKKQRAWHISNKYVEMVYVSDQHLSSKRAKQQDLNKSLVEAICRQSIGDVYRLVFVGADPNCNTGKSYAVTPYLLAKHLNYKIIAEFLAQNSATSEASPPGHVTDRIANSQRRSDSAHKPKPPNTIRDYLHKYGGDFRSSSSSSSSDGDSKPSRGIGLIKSALQQGDFQRRLCILENNMLKYYDADRQTVMKDEISCTELLSVGLCQPEQATKAGMKNCFEVARRTGRTYLFSADRPDTASKWLRGFLAEIFPPYVQNALGEDDQDFVRLGRMWVKSQFRSKKGTDWQRTWCALKGKNFKYFHQDSKTMETLDLRRIIQLVIDKSQGSSAPASPSNGGKDAKDAVNSSPVVMIVFQQKTFYFRSETKADGESWYAALRRADGECRPHLDDQQLSTTGAPIILEKCITFVEQYGLDARGIYRLSGTNSKTSRLLADFTANARDAQMSEKDLNVHDVTGALKRWLKNLPGSLLTPALYESWIATAALGEEVTRQKVASYKQLLGQLPQLNRTTLKVLLNHLTAVARHSGDNDMTRNNLAIVFGPTLMVQSGPQANGEGAAGGGGMNFGKTSEEIACVNDLLNHFDELFDVTEVDRERERLMLQAKEKIVLATQQQNMLTTLDFEMMVPIYITNKDQCVNYKVNVTAGGLVRKICEARKCAASKYSLYEVLQDGVCERVLHHTEHVLSVIKTWSMPSTNFLLFKADYMREKLRWHTANKPVGGVVAQGPLRMYDCRKKWLKVQAVLKVDDQDRLYLDMGKVKGSNAIYLSNYNLYLGVDKKTKPPGNRQNAFTLSSPGETTRHFYADQNLYLWVAQILLHKFPKGFDFPEHFEQEDDPVTAMTSSSDPFETRSPTSSSSAAVGVASQLHRLDLAAELEASMGRRRPSEASILEEEEERQDGGGALQRGASVRAGSNSQQTRLSDDNLEGHHHHHLQQRSASGGSSYLSASRKHLGAISPIQGSRGVNSLNLQSELSDVLRHRAK